MTPIPFVPQQMIDGSRTCGAAALTMIYQSLTLEQTQLSVWQRVAETVRAGVKATRTRRLAFDAEEVGLSAVILQADRPQSLLNQLVAADVRVILNHRLDQESSLGHYSVLLDFDGRQITLHDPHRGPNRVLPWSSFDDLWRPQGKSCEIVGHVLIALGPSSEGSPPCRSCGTEVPLQIACARCSRPLSLGPAGAVTCVSMGCFRRDWRRLFCPSCDWAETRPRIRQAPTLAEL